MELSRYCLKLLILLDSNKDYYYTDYLINLRTNANIISSQIFENKWSKEIINRTKDLIYNKKEKSSKFKSEILQDNMNYFYTDT